MFAAFDAILNGANGMKAEKVKLADGTLRLNLGAGEGAFVIPA